MNQKQIAELSQRLQPYILGWLEGTSAVGGGSGGMSTHALNGLYHSGTLADDQAPQFLKTDGSRSLTGNLTVGAGVTIDSVDLSAFKGSYDTHVADPDAHHSAVTIGTGGLSSYLTMEAGQVLTLGAIAHDDLGGITDSNHHNPVTIGTGGFSSFLSLTGAQELTLATIEHHDLPGLADDDHPQYAALAQNEVITGQWEFQDYVLLTEANDARALRMLYPGHNNVVIESGGDDMFYLMTNDAQDFTGTTYYQIVMHHQGYPVKIFRGAEFVDDSWNVHATITNAGEAEFAHVTTPLINTDSGDLTLSPASGLLLSPGGTITSNASILPGLTDTYDLGSATTLWRKGWLSELESILFVENSIQVTGGWWMVPHQSGTLAQDVSIGASIDFGVGAGALSVNDFILLRGNLQVEYMQITGDNGDGTYNVTRNVDGSGANSWPEGQVWVNLGYAGDGRIEFDAQTANGPRVSIFTQGTSYNVQSELVRMGHLYGWGSFASGQYGIAIGEPGADFLTFEPSEGLVISGDGEGVTNIQGGNIATGTITADQIGAGEITADKITVGQLSAVSADMGVLTAGRILLGSGSLGVDYSGVAMDASGLYYDAQWWNLVGLNNDVLQVGIRSTDGKLTAGGGDVTLDSEGITFALGTTNSYKRGIKWGTSTSPYGYIWSYSSSSISTNQLQMVLEGYGAQRDLIFGLISDAGTPWNSASISGFDQLALGSSGDRVLVNGNLRVDEDAVFYGEIRQGATDYGGYEIQTPGQIYVGSYGVFLGGIHVGGTSNPGTNNLIVDGVTTLGTSSWASGNRLRVSGADTSNRIVQSGGTYTELAQRTWGGNAAILFSAYAASSYVSGDLTAVGNTKHVYPSAMFGSSDHRAKMIQAGHTTIRFLVSGSSSGANSNVTWHNKMTIGVSSVDVDTVFTTLGGVHVGSTGDPGTDNLEVDGRLTVHGDAGRFAHAIDVDYETTSSDTHGIFFYYGNGTSARAGSIFMDVASAGLRVVGGSTLWAYVDDGTGWQAGSSRDLKMNFNRLGRDELRGFADQLYGTPVYLYERKAEPGRLELGVVAQEAPVWMQGSNDERVSYLRSIGFLTAVGKSHEQRIRELEARIAELEAA